MSDTGFVRNDDTGRILSRLVNQSGLVNVGLMRDGIQYKRGVALLVAEAFIKSNRLFESCDTPINLDGDRLNNEVWNLTWRPRWFAAKYFKQFRVGPVGFKRPLEEVRTKEFFKTSWDAAVKYGLLDAEVVNATLNETSVWPTNHKFRVAK